MDNLVQLRNLGLEIVDNFLSLVFLFPGIFNKLPSLVYLLLQVRNGCLIFLSKFDCSFDFVGIGKNSVTQFSASANQSLFRFVRSSQSSVQFFILDSKSFHALLSHEFLQDLSK